jgi:hypothetical protein
MPLILKSLGGLRSDMPCGESIAGPTWFEICINSNWKDWWGTAVGIRHRVIAQRLSGVSDAQRDLSGDWLAEWADGGPAATTAALYQANSTVGARWDEDPGLLWSKGRFRELVEYSVAGANVLKEIGGPDILTQDEGRTDRDIAAFLIGIGAAAVAAVVALVMTR